MRVHGTSGEAPIVRFGRDEAYRLKPLEQRPSFGLLREPIRTVGNDCTIKVDPNSYSVSWRPIGERVAVTVAVHGQAVRRLQRVVDRAHLMVSLVVVLLSVKGRPTA